MVAMWEGINYLFIDEVSMIDCKFLVEISKALTEAKGNTAAFGGINIIFAGDFTQLPPVAQTRLYSRLNTSTVAQGGTKQGQKSIFGKLLWLSVDTVVILKEVMRQRGTENVEFVELLGRLREGRCTDQDYHLLSMRVIRYSGVNTSTPDWTDAPIIVSDNATKDAINEKTTIAFAKRTKQAIHWYYAADRHSGKKVTDPELKDRLRLLNSGQTSQRLGRIPLVLGMPVVIGQNFDVVGGVVNGSVGTLQKILFSEDDKGEQHLTSCVIEIPGVVEMRYHISPTSMWWLFKTLLICNLSTQLQRKSV